MRFALILDISKKIIPRPIYIRMRSVILDILALIKKNQLKDGHCTLRGIKIDVDNKLISQDIQQAMLNGAYEASEARLIQRYLSEKNIVLELGAGIGCTSLLCSRVVGAKNVIPLKRIQISSH